MKRYYTSNDGFVEINDWSPKCWINVERPSDEDFEYLRQELGVPESFLESVSDQDERPRFDREDDWLLTILRIPHKTGGKTPRFSTLTLGIITKDDIIITICHSKALMIDDYISYTQRKHISVVNKPDFILRLIYSSTYWYLNYLKEINNIVSEMVKDLRGNVRNEDLYNLMQQQKALVYFNTALQGNNALAERLDKMFEDDCNPELLDDVRIELQQAQNTVDVYIEILDSTMDTLASVISNDVNQIMKKMTSVSIILMIPTLIASFYGMNVAVAFGKENWAFAGIIVFSLALALVIYLWLRRIKWF